MPAGEALDDDYVISLLTKDAEANKKRYLSSGLGSLLPKRRNESAPKPNTRFLKNIIRDADSHNAALKVKEEEEAAAKLRDLRRDGRSGKRRRESGSEDSKSGKRRRTTDDEGRWARVFGGLGQQTIRQSEKRPRHEKENRPRGSKHYDERHSSRLGSSKDEKGRRTRHDRSSDSKRSRDDDQRESRSGLKRLTDSSGRPSNSRSCSPRNRRRDEKDIPDRRQNGYESDPLDDILGPQRPPRKRPRGRGAYKDASAMDARFDPKYNPKADIDISADDGEGDDWDMALEAMRDRMKWRSQGGDRLRAAGFSEEEVRRWEGSNGLLGRDDTSREKDIDDVKWKKKGEGREWDHGKVVGEDGDVDLRAKWARPRNKAS